MPSLWGNTMTSDQVINLMASEWHKEEYSMPVIYMDEYEVPANVHIQCFQCDKEMFGYMKGSINIIELMVSCCDECSDS